MTRLSKLIKLNYKNNPFPPWHLFRKMTTTVVTIKSPRNGKLQAVICALITVSGWCHHPREMFPPAPGWFPPPLPPPAHTSCFHTTGCDVTTHEPEGVGKDLGHTCPEAVSTWACYWFPPIVRNHLTEYQTLRETKHREQTGISSKHLGLSWNRPTVLDSQQYFTTIYKQAVKFFWRKWQNGDFLHSVLEISDYGPV